METKRFELESLSKRSVDVRFNDEAEIPLLSVTAPSEDVSEVEDNLGSSSLQSPANKDDDNNGARFEAEKIVGDVLSRASEILEFRTNNGEMGGRAEIIITANDGREYRDDDWTTDASHVSDEIETVIEVFVDGTNQKLVSEDVRFAADEFVQLILTLAVEEANRRINEIKQSQWESSRDNLPELNEIIETLSCGDKQRPWYRRARTSVRKLLHRMCVCGREHR